jgi:hypothetical protein
VDLKVWAKARVTQALIDMAAIGDIAKDPRTPEWYRRHLRERLSSGLKSGLSVLFWLHDRTDEMPRDVTTLTNHGTAGLAAFCEAYCFEGPGRPIDWTQLAVEDEEDDEREPTVYDPAPDVSETPWATGVRNAIMARVTYLAAHPRTPIAEARLLMWIGYAVTTSDYVDTGLLERRSLFSDVGLTPQEGQAALSSLIDKRLVCRVRDLDTEDQIALRIIPGDNEPRNGQRRH